MAKIICIGEILVDLISNSNNNGLEEANGFIMAAGGAPANVAVGIARLGINTSFIGKIGNDGFGRFLADTLNTNNVDTTELIVDETAKTSLAFIAGRDNGTKNIIFYRDADSHLHSDEIDMQAIADAKTLHFGSFAFSAQPTRDAVLKSLETAKSNNLMISFDVNHRPDVWCNEADAHKWINKGFEFSDVVKLSEEEFKFATGYANIEIGSRHIMDSGAKLVVVTLGANGCYFDTGTISGWVDGIKVNTVDSLGAGDSFIASLLYSLCGQEISKINKNELINILELCNIAGALATQKRGAIPSLPTKQEIKLFKETINGR